VPTAAPLKPNEPIVPTEPIEPPPAEPGGHPSGCPAEPGAPAPARDVSVDVVRALCILAVVIGHWLVVVPSYRDGRFDGVNALGTVPLMRDLTWVFQVMPLFFVAGGVANLASWRTARARGETYGTWLTGRVRRLVRPTVLLAVVWAATAVVLRAVGIDGELVRVLAWLVVVPVWFLAVYLIVVTLAPVMAAAHERFGATVVVALGAGAAVVDGLRIGTGWAAVGVVNFFLVFLLCQQLGFWWLDGRLQARRTAWALLVGGGGALWLLTHVGPYPVSLVGVPGEAIANNAPPTITLVALGFAQTGLALLARGVLTRLVLRHRIAGAVTMVLNRNAMTILLWHFTALVLTAVVVLPLGIVPDALAGSLAWWGLRVAAVAAMAGPLAVLVAVFGRGERTRTANRSSASTPVPAWRAVVAATAGAVACSMITLGGLNDGGTALLGLPAAALALLGASAVLVFDRRSLGRSTDLAALDQSSLPGGCAPGPHPRPARWRSLGRSTDLAALDQSNVKIASKSSSCS